jgi:hypothetical protein
MVFTDKELVDRKPAPGEFKYITRGMVRVTQDSALGFSILSNELDSPLYRELFDYVLGYVRGE